MFKKDMEFDADNYTITIGETTIAVFDKVAVRIEVKKDKNTQPGRVKDNSRTPHRFSCLVIIMIRGFVTTRCLIL